MLDMQTDNATRKTICEGEADVKNAAGLHMRPAMQFVDVANRYRSTIMVSYDKKDDQGNNTVISIDGKSIMQVTMLGATCGTKLKIKAEGEDAQEAVAALRELIEVKKFDEPTPEEVKRGMDVIPP
jgi:phosphocarrier protein HPr